MTPALLFDIANTYVLPFWTVMILFPNWSVTKKVMGSYLIFLPLIGLYIYYLVATVDPESAATLANPQLADIALFFSQEGSAGAGWVHFLVMDLLARTRKANLDNSFFNLLSIFWSCGLTFPYYYCRYF